EDRRLVARFLHLGRLGLGQREPVERVLAEREQVRKIADGRKARLAHQLDGHAALERLQVQLDILCKARKIGDDQYRLVFIVANESQYFRVLRCEEFDGAAAERLE